mmetsp:Transcript_7867/g.9853  ORF Transcript_7867/g.9853 Transcript_7867/m.9853 type:complete len:99 (+) Transcript_7867:94-390(+)
MAAVPAPIKNVQIFAEDVSEEMRAFAIKTSQEAFQMTITKGKVFGTIASNVRTEFDKEYGMGWNCVAGKSFGTCLTHEIKSYMYFSVLPDIYVLIWKG